MEKIPLDVAFSRFGAEVAGRQRPRWATAQDGSLVLVCLSSGFTRPGAGVLRYTAALSDFPAHVAALRVSLGSAFSSGTPVRLIIQTPPTESASGRIHMRPDLVGSVVLFDGDAYSIDFVRPEEEEPEPPKRKR